MKHFISLFPTIERQFYGSIFAVLACLWCAIGTATLGLLWMTLLPDYHGWGRWPPRIGGSRAAGSDVLVQLNEKMMKSFLGPTPWQGRFALY
jgi:hypothetical protein